MRHRKKKGPGGDTGDKPEPKTTEVPPDESEKTKDAPIKEASKAKPTRLRKCAWICLYIILFLVAFLVLAFLFVVFAMPRIMSEMQVIQGYGDAPSFDLPPEIMENFRRFDVDGNNVLDPYEFATVLQELHNFTEPYIPLDQFSYDDAEATPDKEVMLVEAMFSGIVKESMSKFSDRAQDLLFGKEEALLPGLLLWTQPVHPFHEYGVGNFRAFMPQDNDFTIGRTYFIVKPPLYPGALHSNRYRPTVPSSDTDKLLYTLLSQFHSNAFIHMRFGPQGTVGVIRAKNDEYVDILIRAHVEFQLNQEPHLPFWFTPAQFAGRLIINYKATHIEFFEFTLPTEKQLNIDMEWITAADGSNNEVDIGFVPVMKLIGLKPSHMLGNREVITMNGTRPFEDVVDTSLPDDEVMAKIQAAEERMQMINNNILKKIERMRMPDPSLVIKRIRWKEEIPMEEGKRLLERTLYPFKEVKYHSYLDAFKLAKAEDKFVHFIMLWGALDDQSC